MAVMQQMGLPTPPPSSHYPQPPYCQKITFDGRVMEILIMLCATILCSNRSKNKPWPLLSCYLKTTGSPTVLHNPKKLKHHSKYLHLVTVGSHLSSWTSHSRSQQKTCHHSRTALNAAFNLIPWSSLLNCDIKPNTPPRNLLSSLTTSVWPPGFSTSTASLEVT